MTKCPHTPKYSFSEDMFGHQIVDDYRWLEDATDPQVKDWVAQQNRLTDTYFQGTQVQQIHDELIALNDLAIKTLPRRRGDYYYWYERQPGQAHNVLYRGSKPHQDNPELVFDVNQVSSDSTTALTFFAVSPDSQYAVYGIQQGGLERSTVYIRNLKTSHQDYFYEGRVFKPSWSDNSQGFYYVRSDYQNHGSQVEDESHYQQLYYHQLGQAIGQDQLLFNATDYLPKEAGIFGHASDDDIYIAINCSLGWSKHYAYLLHKPTDSLTKIGYSEEYQQSLRIADQDIYLTTNYQDPNKKILRTTLAQSTQPVEDWTELIATDTQALLENWTDTQDYLLLEYTQDAISQLRIHRKSDGQLDHAIQFDELASLSGIRTVDHSNEFAYSINTFTSPSRQYWSKSPVQEPQLTYQDYRSLSTDDFQTKQVFYQSKDGIKVPMFIISPAKLSETAPTILYGYGGFGHSTTPGFLSRYLPWLSRGGVVALPCLRGGGEYGEAWHQAGMLSHKQQSFDDMIAAAQYLINQKITQSSQLVIQGGSNGGLLVGACLTQQPQLFKAAISAVPLLDMIRFHKFLLAHRWKHEYGDPEVESEFNWLIKYSPYHHVDRQQTYPSVLLTAGINDTRVHPLHAWKMAALLQDTSTTNPILLRTDLSAGHQGGGGFYQSVAKSAESLAFAIKEVGLE